jgi:hypothetical protein
VSRFLHSTVSQPALSWRQRSALGFTSNPRATRRLKLRVAFLMVAWFAATGAHWDVLQVVAWGRMALNYSETMPLSSAVKRTFEPDSSCPLCRMVSKAKQQEQKPGAPLPPEAKASAKMVLYLHENAGPPAPTMILQNYALVESRVISHGRAQPPSPPPKV